MIVLSTVPSTGTNFMRDILWTDRSQHGLPNLISADASTPVCFTHMWKDRWPHIRQAGLDGATFVTPMRDPALSWGTWMFHRVTDLEFGKRLQCYEVLLDQDSYFEDVWYIPIDLLDKRDAAMQAMGDRIGMKIETAWKPANTNGMHKFARSYHEGQPWRCWPEGRWDLLKKYEPRLRPLLERIGYRDLMWWSK